MDSRHFKWDVVLDSLQKELPQEEFDNWIGSLQFQSNDHTTVLLASPSHFIKGWVLTNYKKKILHYIQQQLPKIINIDIIVTTFINSPPETPLKLSPAKAVETPVTTHLECNLVPNYKFKHFVVGAPNEFAYAAAQKIAKDPQVLFNPLFIYGGVGLGKTHLMHAIAWHILEDGQNRRCLYLSAEKYMNLYVKALNNKDMMNFKETFRSTDVLMIDDFQFIGGKEQTQEEFFHSFNSLIEQGKQIIISADKAPSDLSRVEERIISRLNAGLVASIHATTYELRIDILKDKIQQLKVKVPEEVIQYLAHNIVSNVRELEGALKRVLARQVLINRKITLELAMEATEDIVRNNYKAITIEQIQKIVSEHYNIKLSDLLSNKRLKKIARAKQIAMYLAKTLTSYSFADIGKKFNGKDHSTVLYSFKKIETALKNDPDLDQEIKCLSKTIKKM